MRSAREIAKGPAPETDTGGTGARKTTRVCAFLLAALVGAHLVFLFELTGESLVWPNAMLDLQDRLQMPVSDSHGPVGLAFAILGTLFAIAIWRWASLVGALVFAAALGWEVYSHAIRLWPPILLGESIPPMAMLSAGLAGLGLLVSLVALFAGFAHLVGKRKNKAAQSQKAEAMALRIRAQR